MIPHQLVLLALWGVFSLLAGLCHAISITDIVDQIHGDAIGGISVSIMQFQNNVTSSIFRGNASHSHQFLPNTIVSAGEMGHLFLALSLSRMGELGLSQTNFTLYTPVTDLVGDKIRFKECPDGVRPLLLADVIAHTTGFPDPPSYAASIRLSGQYSEDKSNIYRTLSARNLLPSELPCPDPETPPSVSSLNTLLLAAILEIMWGDERASYGDVVLRMLNDLELQRYSFDPFLRFSGPPISPSQESARALNPLPSHKFDTARPISRYLPGTQLQVTTQTLMRIAEYVAQHAPPTNESSVGIPMQPWFYVATEHQARLSETSYRVYGPQAVMSPQISFGVTSLGFRFFRPNRNEYVVYSAGSDPIGSGCIMWLLGSTITQDTNRTTFPPPQKSGGAACATGHGAGTLFRLMISILHQQGVVFDTMPISAMNEPLSVSSAGFIRINTRDTDGMTVQRRQFNHADVLPPGPLRPLSTDIMLKNWPPESPYIGFKSLILPHANLLYRKNYTGDFTQWLEGEISQSSWLGCSPPSFCPAHWMRGLSGRAARVPLSSTGAELGGWYSVLTDGDDIYVTGIGNTYVADNSELPSLGIISLAVIVDAVLIGLTVCVGLFYCICRILSRIAMKKQRRLLRVESEGSFLLQVRRRFSMRSLSYHSILIAGSVLCTLSLVLSLVSSVVVPLHTKQLSVSYIHGYPAAILDQSLTQANRFFKQDQRGAMTAALTTELSGLSLVGLSLVRLKKTGTLKIHFLPVIYVFLAGTLVCAVWSFWYYIHSILVLNL